MIFYRDLRGEAIDIRVLLKTKIKQLKPQIPFNGKSRPLCLSGKFNIVQCVKI
jgi:hypothetical protein